MSEGYMYILECGDGTFYTGSTVNLDKRLWEHQNGQGANYTKKKPPLKLVYFEKYGRIDEAFYREKQVQGWSHAKKRALIIKTNKELPALAECKNDSHYKNARFNKPAVSTSLNDRGIQDARTVNPENGSLSGVEVTAEGGRR